MIPRSWHCNRGFVVVRKQLQPNTQQSALQSGASLYSFSNSASQLTAVGGRRKCPGKPKLQSNKKWLTSIHCQNHGPTSVSQEAGSLTHPVHANDSEPQHGFVSAYIFQLIHPSSLSQDKSVACAWPSLLAQLGSHTQLAYSSFCESLKLPTEDFIYLFISLQKPQTNKPTRQEKPTPKQPNHKQTNNKTQTTLSLSFWEMRLFILSPRHVTAGVAATGTNNSLCSE